MLDMLEATHPAGVPTTRIAGELYSSDSMENRVKVSRLARTLRQMGYHVYGVGGIYSLSTEAVLEVVVRRYEKMACGFLRGGAQAAREMNDLGAPLRGKKLRRELKQSVSKALKAI
jgi:hypothetical protein